MYILYINKQQQQIEEKDKQLIEIQGEIKVIKSEKDKQFEECAKLRVNINKLETDFEDEKKKNEEKVHKLKNVLFKICKLIK